MNNDELNKYSVETYPSLSLAEQIAFVRHVNDLKGINREQRLQKQNMTKMMLRNSLLRGKLQEIEMVFNSKDDYDMKEIANSDILRVKVD